MLWFKGFIATKWLWKNVIFTSLQILDRKREDHALEEISPEHQQWGLRRCSQNDVKILKIKLKRNEKLLAIITLSMSSIQTSYFERESNLISWDFTPLVGGRVLCESSFLGLVETEIPLGILFGGECCILHSSSDWPKRGIKLMQKEQTHGYRGSWGRLGSLTETVCLLYTVEQKGQANACSWTRR